MKIKAVRPQNENHATDQTTWRDVSSLHLAAGQWQMNESRPLLQSERALASLSMKNTGKYRYAQCIEVAGTPDCGQITITRPDKGAVGCRVVAEALARLACFCGDIDNLPVQLYIRVNEGSFLIRGLLMLRTFCDPEMRQDIRDHYPLSHVAARFFEKAPAYEERAVGELLSRYVGYVAEDPGLLCLTDVKSKPDGFFTNTQSKTGVIAETKMNRPDFSDGTAQIMQYYAQARHRPEFKDWALKLCLVASQTEPTKGYALWERWMKSDRKLNAFVAE
jgi:hypothetical protein